jgi:CBS domain-containing protein
MIICPFCDAENIEGSDECEQCGQALSDFHLPVPATYVERSLLSDRVRILQPRTPIVVPPHMAVSDVLNLLVERKIGCVLVVEDDRILGVFSERDALTRIGTDAQELGHCPISQFMTRHPQELDPDAKIAFAVRMMDLGGYRHVPVVDPEGKPVGMVSVRDILRYLTEKMTVSR